MKKKITAILIALIITFPGLVHADYYMEFERPDVTFAEMMDFDPDFEKAEKSADKIISMIEKNENSEKIFSKLEETFGQGILPYSTREGLDYILSSIDNSPENNARLLESSEAVLRLHQKMTKIIRLLWENNKYRKDLILWDGSSEEELAEALESFPSDEEYALQEEVNILLEEYYNNQSGVSEFELDGKKYTREDIAYLVNSDNTDALMAYIEKTEEKLGNIFINLVNARNRIAKIRGYENYAEYAFAEVYPKDFSENQRYGFYEGVKAYIVTLFTDLIDSYAAMSQFHTEDTAFSDDELLTIVRRYLAETDPELTDAFDYMISHGLYDIENSSNKKTGSFTAFLDQFKVPFILINQEDGGKLSTLVHEYGHFTSMFHDPYIAIMEDGGESESMNLDISEIHSQGLEVLFMDYSGEIYGSDGTFKRLEQIATLCSAITEGCLYSQWQEKIYAEDNLSVSRANQLFAETCREYNFSDLYLSNPENDKAWMSISHNFETPMYYISYALSAAACLELYETSLNDRASAIDKYMKLSAMGAYCNFSEALSAAGFSDIFNTFTLENAASTIRSSFGLSYTDISSDDWFFPVITETAGFMDGISETEFAPNDNADRLTFINAVGKMYDDCEEVIFPDTSPFKDTDSPYASWAYENHITDGVGEGILGADSPLTREMAVCFLYRMAGSPQVSSDIKFTDAQQVSDWAKDAVLWAQEWEIINGYSDGSFRPGKALSRAEAAMLIAAAYFMIF